MKTIKKFLLNVLVYLMIPLDSLAESLAKKVGEKGARSQRKDEDRVTLREFLDLCIEVVDATHFNRLDLDNPDLSKDEIETLHKELEVEVNDAWKRLAILQGKINDEEERLFMAETFGRVLASLRIRDLKRVIGMLNKELDEAECARPDMSVVQRLAQATARLSVIQIAIEEQKAMSASITAGALHDPPCVDYPGDGAPQANERSAEENVRRAGEVLMEESARASALNAVEMILKQPMDQIRERLQDFYDKHPERRGTLVFTSAATPVRMPYTTSSAAMANNAPSVDPDASNVASDGNNKVSQ